MELGLVYSAEKYYVIPGIKNYYLTPNAQMMRFSKSFTPVFQTLIPNEGKRVFIINGETHYVHDLLARVFIPGWCPGSTVRHIDGNTLNNGLHNLSLD